MATIVTLPVKASQAVLAFNKINAMVSYQLANNTQRESIPFWINLHETRTNEIAKKYNLTVTQLIEQWEMWFAASEAAQAKAKAGN
jgi:hypothetical protein